MQLRAAVIVWLLYYPSVVAAYEIRHADVSLRDGEFHLVFEVLLDVPAATVYRLITDAAAFARLNDMVLESRIISEKNAGRRTRQMLLHPCILFYCKEIRVVEEMQEIDHNAITAIIVPLQSDFKSGSSHWLVKPVGSSRSLLSLDSQLVPDFWIPPLIGTWLIKSQLRQEWITMSQRIEMQVQN